MSGKKKKPGFAFLRSRASLPCNCLCTQHDTDKCKCQDKNWGFIFMGANIDAFSAGSQYGLGVNNTLQYAASGSGVNLSMASATRAVNSLKAEAKTEGFNVRSSYETYGFTDEERTKSMGSE